MFISNSQFRKHCTSERWCIHHSEYPRFRQQGHYRHQRLFSNQGGSIIHSLLRTSELRAELIGCRIRVNAVSPSPIEPPILEKAGLSQQAIDEVTKLFIARNPMKHCHCCNRTSMLWISRSPPLSGKRTNKLNNSKKRYTLLPWR